MNKVAVYTRYSSDNQRDESIEAQIRAVKEYSQRNNMQIVKIYSDEARSATTDDRPQFQQMIRDSALGIFNTVVVHKLDRFARDRYDSAFYKRQLRNNGVKLVSVLEQFDDSPESIILESVLEGMAEYYSKNLAREVMKGMKETAYHHKHTGGIPPLGLDVNSEGHYVINEKEAAATRLVFDYYLEGYGYGKIAEMLNNQGYRTKTGKSFAKNSIYELLRNEKYKGTYVFNRRSGKANGKRNNHLQKNEDEVIRVPNALPAIIDPVIFDKVQDKLNNLRRGPRMASKRVYLLTGLIECGDCGGAYTGDGYRHGRGGKQYVIYSCTNRKSGGECKNKSIRQDVLEAYAIQKLNDQIFSDNALSTWPARILEYAGDYDAQSQHELTETKKLLAETTRRMEALIDALEDGTLDRDVIKGRMERYKQEKARHQTRLIELQSKSYDWLDEEKVLAYLRQSGANLESGDPKLQRKVIETFVNKVIIHPDRIETTLKIWMDSDKVGGGEPCITLSLSDVLRDVYAPTATN